jgi:type I restriction enzyme S subunit
MSELPEGWIHTLLSDVAHWGSGGTPSRNNPAYYGGRIPWIKTGELGQGVITDTEEKITELGLQNSSAKLFPKGSVAVAMYGATIGKTAILGIEAATNQACAVGIPIEGVITTEYLLHYLASQKDAFVEAGKGGAQPNISQSVIKNWAIPLAPLNEQKRIADKLDRLLARVDACRERCDRIPLILNRFRQSVLTAAISGELTENWRESNPDLVDASDDATVLRKAHEDAGGHKRGNAADPTDEVHDLEISMFPEGWQLMELRDLVRPDKPITYGILKPGPELEDGIPYIRVADFPKNKLNLTTIRKTSPAIDTEFARSRLSAGDILLSIRGTVGRLVVIPPELSGANITQDSARLSIQDSVERDYVLWFLRSEFAQTRMKQAEKGVAVRGINIGDVRALQVPLPSKSEQQEIIRRITALFTYADRLETRYQTAHAQVDRLTPALLDKAFRGELVPQDPNDEPATVLLEQIRSELATAKTNKSERGKRVTVKSTSPLAQVIMLTRKDVRLADEILTELLAEDASEENTQR